MTLHPSVKRLLDGEISLADLPAELRPEAERALRLVSLAEGAPILVTPQLEQRVMDAVRRHAAQPRRSLWRSLVTPRELRLRVRPWFLGPALAAVAALAILAGRSRVATPVPDPAAPVSALVRFVFYAPDASAVAVAGSFNDWSPVATPLARTAAGVWTITLALPLGQHQYAFVVDGRRWMADPAAPAVDDGFGRRNSILAVDLPGAAL